MTEAESYFYPNRMGRIILLSMEEVMGLNGVRAVLNLAPQNALKESYPPDSSERVFPFKTLSQLMGTLEQIYGPHGGRGLAIRVGRACFQNGLRLYGPQLGITEPAFRLLPLSSRIKAGAKVFAGLFNTLTDQKVKVDEEPGRLLWVIERCPVCWERQSREPACHLAVGILQEALYWLSAGRVFSVEEKTCVAAGDENCTIVIDQTPVI